jgi:hypothetical protein
MYSFLNSPLTLAIVSGLIINLAVAQWQERAAAHQRAENRRIDLQKMKSTVFVEFADQFAHALALAQNFKARECWLRNTREQPLEKRGLYPDGRGFVETLAESERVKAEFLKGRMPDSLCAQVRTCFQTKAVLARVDGLQEKCDKLIESFDATQIVSTADAINSDYKTLLREMADELRTN